MGKLWMRRQKSADSKMKNAESAETARDVETKSPTKPSNAKKPCSKSPKMLKSKSKSKVTGHENTRAGHKRRREGADSVICAQSPPTKKQRVRETETQSASAIRDANTDSESARESEEVTVRRSPRKTKGIRKSEKKKKELFSSDLYGTESDDESLSEDEHKEKQQIHAQRQFERKKRRNKLRMAKEQQKQEMKDTSNSSSSSKRSNVNGRVRSKDNRQNEVKGGSSSKRPKNGTKAKSKVKSKVKAIKLKSRKSKDRKETVIKTVTAMVRPSQRRRSVESAKAKTTESAIVDGGDSSDSPSLSLSDSDMNATATANEGRDAKTRQILEKFVSAYEAKGNVTMWLHTLKAMSAEQLAIIKHEAKFVRCLKKLRSDDKFKTLCAEILKKCK